MSVVVKGLKKLGKAELLAEVNKKVKAQPNKVKEKCARANKLQVRQGNTVLRASTP